MASHRQNAPKTAEDIRALIEERVPESRVLEFKQELPGNSTKDKMELCYDVSALANTAGGAIVFGVVEQGGVAHAIRDVGQSSMDETTRRVMQILDAHIEPRLTGIQLSEIDVDNERLVILAIPKSWMGPHLVRVNDSFRVCGRHSSGRFLLDSTQIREAFAASEQRSLRQRRWRDERVAMIYSGRAPVPLSDAPMLIVHMVPGASALDVDRFSIAELEPSRDITEHSASGEFERLNARALGGNLVNADGLLVGAGGDKGSHSGYCQVFRSGAVEAVEQVGRPDQGTALASQAIHRYVLEGVSQNLRALTRRGVEYPISVMVALTSVEGWHPYVDPNHFHSSIRTCDRDVLILPQVLLEAEPRHLPRTMQPVFDAAWNAFGARRSSYLDQAGNWTVQREPLDGVPQED